MANAARADNSFLPDFCSERPVLVVLLITQLVAFLLLLAGRMSDAYLWERLLLLSLYLHWIGLSSAVVLCGARRRLMGLPSRVVTLACFVLLLLVTALISECAWQLAQWLEIRHYLPDQSHSAFLIRNLAICAIVSAMALRYFWLQAQWRGQIRAEAESRYQALQARIRPHFLFNSLNSIAALIGSRPQEAETAVEDLAQLFRAGLSVSQRRIPLEDELEVTRAYLRTESLRMGDRLNVDWQVEEGLESQLVPPLSLQPLVENAVTHGIESIADGGTVTISIKKPDNFLMIRVENPLPDEVQASQGTRLALNNIRERLLLTYGESASLSVTAEAGTFSAQLKLPLTALESAA